MHISTDCSSHSYMKRSFFTMVGIRIDLKSIGFQKRIQPLALVSFPVLTVKQFCQWLFLKCKGKANVEIMNGLLAKMHLAAQKRIKSSIQESMKKYTKTKSPSAEEQLLQEQLKEAHAKISL